MLFNTPDRIVIPSDIITSFEENETNMELSILNSLMWQEWEETYAFTEEQRQIIDDARSAVMNHEV